MLPCLTVLTFSPEHIVNLIDELEKARETKANYLLENLFRVKTSDCLTAESFELNLVFQKIQLESSPVCWFMSGKTSTPFEQMAKL